MAWGLICLPLQQYWDPSIPGGYQNHLARTKFLSFSNLTLDIWILYLPLPTILRLQVSKMKKIGLCCLFSVGLLTIGIAATRLIFLFVVRHTDYTWKPNPLPELQLPDLTGQGNPSPWPY
ncbi:hypothetical protein BDW74DRAFT_179990 [Aspergillus multicolor]|uniref:uncharacterized protein n=1 Tax=Aspergillus multicolor TaxID=41759 RepID=UPI003CCD7343